MTSSRKYLFWSKCWQLLLSPVTAIRVGWTFATADFYSTGVWTSAINSSWTKEVFWPFVTFGANTRIVRATQNQSKLTQLSYHVVLKIVPGFYAKSCYAFFTICFVNWLKNTFFVTHSQSASMICSGSIFQIKFTSSWAVAADILVKT